MRELVFFFLTFLISVAWSHLQKQICSVLFNKSQRLPVCPVMFLEESACFSSINIPVNLLPIFNSSVFAEFSVDVPTAFRDFIHLNWCALAIYIWVHDRQLFVKSAFARLFIKNCSFCHKCRYLPNCIRLISQTQ